MITTENYEPYLMRYADGELADAERLQVEAFLEQHPELRRELEELCDPAIRVTPPLATMPDKKSLMHREAHAWLRVAAVIVFFIMAAGAVRLLLPTAEPSLITAENDSTITILQHGDTITPDSLYINTGKRLPVYLAEQVALPRPHTNNDYSSAAETAQPENDTLFFENDHDDMFLNLQAIAEHDTTDGVKAEQTYRIVGGMIIVANAQLAESVPSTPPTNNPNVTIGQTVESTMLAENSQGNLLERTKQALVRLLRLNQAADEPLLAFSE
ncbi:MAG: hypothetical protein IJR26_09980 [Bacteroidales bacterium]|nr:hypothetical protein [Bacteroidales bacterium]